MDSTQAIEAETRFMPFPVALMVWSGIALFFLLVSWAAGGDKFKDSIYGNYGLVVMVAGLVVGGVLTALSRKK